MNDNSDALPSSVDFTRPHPNGNRDMTPGQPFYSECGAFPEAACSAVRRTARSISPGGGTGRGPRRAGQGSRAGPVSGANHPWPGRLGGRPTSWPAGRGVIVGPEAGPRLAGVPAAAAEAPGPRARVRAWPTSRRPRRTAGRGGGDRGAGADRRAGSGPAADRVRRRTAYPARSPTPSAAMPMPSAPRAAEAAFPGSRRPALRGGPAVGRGPPPGNTRWASEV